MKKRCAHKRLVVIPDKDGTCHVGCWNCRRILRTVIPATRAQRGKTS